MGCTAVLVLFVVLFDWSGNSLLFSNRLPYLIILQRKSFASSLSIDGRPSLSYFLTFLHKRALTAAALY